MTDREFDMLLDELGAREFVELIDKVAPPQPQVKAPVEKPKAKKKAKSAINDSELDMMFADIQATFTGSFKNKDLGSLLDKWGLSARQTPSRLKKLVDAGLLQDLGGSPKSYEVK